MAQSAEQFHDILLDDIKGHPELITDILFDDEDLSLILEKRGKTVRFAYLRRYDRESMRILREAKQEYTQQVQKGYTREQAAHDFLDAQEEIQQQLASS